jgi:RNA polymerase sigma factor (sigma-70 family)
MSAPASVRIDVNTLSLDDLGLLVRHPRAPASARNAFVKALAAWTQARVALVARTMRNLDETDREDIAQEFLLQCLTRHLRQWQPTLSTITAFLFPRLRCVVIDAWRRRVREGQRDGGDECDREDERADVERGPRRVRLEACYAVVAAAITRLPKRQRSVMRLVLAGDSLGDVAAALGVHPSTVSRERSAALTRLRGALPVDDEEAAVLLAAA